jgi:class 3 adenylate cyclase
MADPLDERKPVTVLFADLVGLTELATRQNPEHLRSMLAAFFDEMREQIQAFGGTVEKYAGDAIMAVFGVPRVNEDDAERAVRAALAMRQSLEQLNPLFEKDYGVRLALRVGVATGEAVAAAGTANEFMVTGEVPRSARPRCPSDPRRRSRWTPWCVRFEPASVAAECLSRPCTR